MLQLFSSCCADENPYQQDCRVDINSNQHDHHIRNMQIKNKLQSTEYNFYQASIYSSLGDDSKNPHWNNCSLDKSSPLDG